jgi:Cellulase (glycosyl hydrolase family 5)
VRTNFFFKSFGSVAASFGCVLIFICTSAFGNAVELEFLHTRGHDIVTEKGEKVLLRGVGLGNWMLPEGYMWKFGNPVDRPRRIEKLVSDLIGPENGKRFWTEFRHSYITEADVHRIAELGYNSVRPALNSRLFLKESGEVDPASEGFQLLDNLVKWSKANGIYVIIDMHGAPGGQTGQNIDDSADDQPELFMQPKYEEQLVNLWVAIARRYSNEPAVTGYDLLNEPLPSRTGAAARYKARLEPLYKRLTKAIREVDKKHMVIIEGFDWANDWSVFTGPFDKNLVYQFHYYCWDNPAAVKSIGRYLDYRKRFNAPVWVGETGERDSTIYWATTDYFEANNIGWAFWPWKKLDADNCPVSIKRPAQWDAIVAYSRGEAKPSSETAQNAFDELLKNIRLENCVSHPAVVNAMLRKVPGRIEAENFGHNGSSISYHVKNTTQRSKFYRTGEPVPISVGESRRPRSSQFITLSGTEWTAYTIDSTSQQDCEVIVRARATNAPVVAELTIGEKAVGVNLTDTAWKEIKVGAIPFSRGVNRLKWLVKQGTADLDWIDVRSAIKSDQSTTQAHAAP